MKKFVDSIFSTGGLFILIIIAARLTFLQHTHLDLSPKEAFFWYSAQDPQSDLWKIYPLFLFIIKGISNHFPTCEYFLRIIPLICTSIYLITLYYFAYQLTDNSIAIWSMLIAAVNPFMDWYSFVLSPMSLFMFFWVLSLYWGWKATAEKKILYFWITGFILALGILASPLMWSFLPFYGIWLYIDKKKNCFPVQNFLYLLSPCLLIFLSFHEFYGKFNFSLFMENLSYESFPSAKFLNSWLFQPLLSNPIFFLFFLTLIVLFIKRPKLRQHSWASYLFILSAPPFFFSLLLTLALKIKMDISSPFYTGAYILVATLALRAKWPWGKEALIRKIFLLGVLGSMIITIIIYRLPVMPDKFPPSWNQIIERFYGWQELAKHIENLFSPGMNIFSSNKYLSAEISFYLPSHPKIYLWKGKEICSLKRPFLIISDNVSLYPKKSLCSIKRYSYQRYFLKKPIQKIKIFLGDE